MGPGVCLDKPKAPIAATTGTKIRAVPANEISPAPRVLAADRQLRRARAVRARRLRLPVPAKIALRWSCMVFCETRVRAASWQERTRRARAVSYSCCASLFASQEGFKVVLAD
jgi:hypothetical protein